MDFPGGSYGEESACNERHPGLVLGSRRLPGEENGYPLQYSCLENCMDRGAWRATVHPQCHRVRHDRATNTHRHTWFQQSQSLIHTQTSSPQPKYSRIPIFNLLIYHISTMKILFKNLLIVREDWKKHSVLKREEMPVSTQSYCDFLFRQRGGLKHLETANPSRATCPSGGYQAACLWYSTAECGKQKRCTTY